MGLGELGEAGAAELVVGVVEALESFFWSRSRSEVVEVERVRSFLFFSLLFSSFLPKNSPGGPGPGRRRSPGSGRCRCRGSRKGSGRCCWSSSGREREEEEVGAPLKQLRWKKKRAQLSSSDVPFRIRSFEARFSFSFSQGRIKNLESSTRETARGFDGGSVAETKALADNADENDALCRQERKHSSSHLL